jgi:hypothetical protein
MNQQVRLPLDARFLTAFAALSFLVMAAHELVHHLTARVACGAWGQMTFWQFFVDAGCMETRVWLFSTLAGPLLTHALIWTGALLILRGKALAGIALVFANLPLARIVTVLMKGGDEMVLGRTLVGDGSWLPLLALTVALVVPPLVVAYRALGQRRRAALFAAFLVLPMFWDMLLKRLLLSRLLDEVTAEVNGIPVLIIATWIAAGALLFLLWPRSGSSGGERALPGAVPA